MARKYRNQPTAGYASKKEAKRAAELALMAKASVIRDFKAQVRFEVIPSQKGERPAHYVADFAYYELEALSREDQERHPSCRGVWTYVVEDTKGVRTPAYVLKRKLMLLVHGIRIRET